MRTDNGSIMDIEDVIDYVMFQKKQYPDWNLDDITGGIDHFISKEKYYYIKKWFVYMYE